jgi:hypothetical protein
LTYEHRHYGAYSEIGEMRAGDFAKPRRQFTTRFPTNNLIIVVLLRVFFFPPSFGNKLSQVSTSGKKKKKLGLSGDGLTRLGLTVFA